MTLAANIANGFNGGMERYREKTAKQRQRAMIHVLAVWLRRRGILLRTVSVAVLCWIVSASPVRTIDGDTFVAVASIWPAMQATLTVRVLGVNTPERKGETRAAGEKARAFTQAWLDKGDVMLAVGCGVQAQDSFGRYLAIVQRDRAVLADELIAAGHGVKR